MCIRDRLGQRKGADGFFSPGLDFGFGLVGDSYIDRAKDRGWLLLSVSLFL